MRIYGLDFTSAPRRRKPLTCARCFLEGDTLRVIALDELVGFDALRDLLARPGPWVAGFDFPFGQPRRLVANLGWSESWAGYVELVADWDMKQFEAVLKAYRDPRPRGDKQHLRRTDELARSRSPMMLYGVPVGRMFFRGAPLLLDSGASVLPCHPADPDRVVLEVYPALAARAFSGSASYKAESRRKQTAEKTAARQQIVDSLRGAAGRDYFGLAVDLTDDMAALLVRDAKGDTLDSVLAACAAAWGAMRRETGWGIPPDADALEGWIVDPALDSQ